MPLPLYSRGKCLTYTLDRRLGGPQSWSGRRGEEKILDPTGTKYDIYKLYIQTFACRDGKKFMK
jgi:hypothetical protein